MLYHIRDELGFHSSKHDRENILVAIEHGDAYDCPGGCDICLEKGPDAKVS
jgi:hypothetical protein